MGDMNQAVVRTASCDVGKLREAFDAMSGKRFIGTVDGVGCTEFVFEPGGQNLVTLFHGEPWHGQQVAVGFVTQELIDGGYVAPDV